MKITIPLMKSTFLHGSKTKRALADFIMSTDRLSMGVKCKQFETEFAEFQGAQEAVLFNSGASSNISIFQTLVNLGRLKAGDTIGISALTWATNVTPILQLGMIPVPIDCEPTTLNVMSKQLKARLSEQPLKAFFITNALGFAGDLDVIRKICQDAQVIFIEDNCESLGTRLVQGLTGTFGEMASFSFFVAHHMSTVEGGMVCTNNREFAHMLRMIRANGWDRNLDPAIQKQLRSTHHVQSEIDSKYAFYDIGFNFRPTEITGFLGSNQLKYLPQNIQAREQNYLKLAKVAEANSDLLKLDHHHLKNLSSFAFPVICKTPQLKVKYMQKFASAGVEVRPMIGGNIQRQPFYRKYVQKSYPLPGTDQIHEGGFYFGNYPELTEKDLQLLLKLLAK